MTTPDPFTTNELLPETLPEDPMPLFAEWVEEAQRERVQPNPTAMTLCTVDPDGRPSGRVVLCRAIVKDPGFIRFYTNKQSRKGQALRVHRYASCVFHWDALDRQVRIEGPVTDATEEESDAYFNARHPMSRAGAWASQQSQPIASRDDLLAQVMQTVMELGLDFDQLQDGAEVTIPRPAHWGGYRVWAQRVELWAGSPVRIHDRAVWTRELEPRGEDDFAASAWIATRLQP
ncbi:MAG: pyridoxamine 5'-phosphate oxidase [Phycisphaerales bacterium]